MNICIMNTDKWKKQIGKRIKLKSQYINSSGEAILLRNITTLEGEVFRDHIWLPSTKKFEKLNLMKNDQIIFEGKINTYYKGHEPEKIYGVYLYRHDQVLVPDITVKNINILEVIRYVPEPENELENKDELSDENASAI